MEDHARGCEGRNYVCTCGHESHVEKLKDALFQFYLEGWTDENGWTDLAAQNDRIRDWFGPSDFQRVKELLSTPPKPIPNPMTEGE